MKTIDFHWAIPVSMALTTTLLLTACGGGGGGGGYIPPAAGTSTPDGGMQAADPYADFLAYVMALIGTSPETGQAADVAKFDPPPTSETKEAIPTP